MTYMIIKYLHIISIFGFLLTHGVSVQVAYALKSVRDLQKIRTLLSLSKVPYTLMLSSLLASILFGVVAGFQGHWWGYGWIWVSIALLVGIMTYMYSFGTSVFGAVRVAADLPPDSSGLNKELLAALQKNKPVMLTIVGYGGFAIITWLMIFKPF